MDKLLRVEKIKQLLLAAGGKISGRKKLQKLAYLCQEAGTDLGQSFTFHYYGVYSPSLAHDLVIAEDWNEITEKPDGFGFGYIIELNPETIVEKESTLTSGFDVVNALAHEAPAVLEVLSTIVYLDRHGFSGNELISKLRELKGHLETHFDHSLQLASEYYGITT